MRVLWRLCQPLAKAFAAGERLYNELSFLLGAGSFRAAVTAGKFLDPTRSIDKLLFAGEKGMTSGTNADLNIATRGASVIHRTACAHHISFVVFWMNVWFHLLNGARNVFATAGFCKR
jgi:hypothetical protein